MFSLFDSFSNDINKIVYITQIEMAIAAKRAKALKGSIEIYEQIKNVIKHTNPSIKTFLDAINIAFYFILKKSSSLFLYRVIYFI